MFLTILWCGFSFLALCLLFVRAREVAVKWWERRREVRKSTGVEEGWCGGWDVKEVEEEEEKEGKTNHLDASKISFVLLWLFSV